MKIKELEGKIGEKVVYAVPNGRRTTPEVVTVRRIVEPGTVSVTKSGGYWSGHKNAVRMVEIEFPPHGRLKIVPAGHISTTTVEDYEANAAEAEAWKKSEAARKADEKSRGKAVEARLVELGVIELATSMNYETGSYEPSSRLRYSDTLNLTIAELEKLVALLEES